MNPPEQSKAALLPDIANEARPGVAGRLDWVGMNQVEIPVRVQLGNSDEAAAQARATVFVNLIDPAARGIHMSRLYLLLEQTLAENALSPCALRRVLHEFLESHRELSDRALIRLDFDLLVRRPALVSEHHGWRRYPVSLIAELNGGEFRGREFRMEMAVQVLYSSTCPCSAALARQLIQQQFDTDFAAVRQPPKEAVRAWLGGEQGVSATPHSQRSAADVRVRLTPSFEAFPLLELIDRLEVALQTAVQAAVKREDEQAFARLNGANLMFCEDAARRIRKVLDGDERIVDFWARCRHFESLHPHNAVAIVTKGLSNGFAPIDGTPAGWHD